MRGAVTPFSYRIKLRLNIILLGIIKMKKQLHKSLRLTATLLVALSASIARGYSGSIDLTFAGRGESSTVDKVIITNITQPGSVPDIRRHLWFGCTLLRHQGG